MIWEFKHSAGCCQIARILAQKRGLDITICETAALLHDIYVIFEGKYANHAKLGEPIAQKYWRILAASPTHRLKLLSAL